MSGFATGTLRNRTLLILAASLRSTRNFALQIVALRLVAVMVAGFLLGRPGSRASIPEQWISGRVGNSSGA